MKTKLLSIGLSAAASMALAHAASASLFYEPFDYSNGTLATSTPASGGNTNNTAPSSVTVNATTFNNTNVWTNGSNPSGTVITGDLSYPNLPTTNTGHMVQLTGAAKNPDRIAIGDFPQDSTIWFSMLLQVPTGVSSFGSTGAGSFLAGFQYNPTTVGASTTMTDTSAGGAGVLTIHKDAAGTGYNLGIGYRDINSGTSRIFETDELTAGTTYLVVGSLAINAGDFNDVAKLWINPDPTAAAPGTPSAVSDNSVIHDAHDYFYNNTSGALLDTHIRSFYLRSNASEPSKINLDNIRIGSSYADVNAVPEPTSVVMLGLGALGALVRRRRTA